ncbi:uncharacterized protein K452DRAFT_99659 [Aplosporella prunicola CBS 121167]|uniref:Uncharacterized protein n=1 Tax=Aplosporella prunicola CBS 121167 TaxID=1176127 RepID=A0A6A6B2Y1_9PEZI|nr:uncharacterized protein K452DRAFT_99659 [Aplosporella prunicola CBS 121167]KAF2137605.1 hypothetical protein K452DRAFT_99659 [Aplosporella prunicola CBS 121167]
MRALLAAPHPAPTTTGSYRSIPGHHAVEELPCPILDASISPLACVRPARGVHVRPGPRGLSLPPFSHHDGLLGNCETSLNLAISAPASHLPPPSHSSYHIVPRRRAPFWNDSAPLRCHAGAAPSLSSIVGLSHAVPNLWPRALRAPPPFNRPGRER